MSAATPDRLRSETRTSAPARAAAGAPPGSRREAAAASAAPPASGRSGYRTLFRVPFHGVMSDADLARLNSVLDMATHLHPKLPVVAEMPGVARLDFFSGLLLVRGDGDDEWRLEGRTWGAPAPAIVHGWHLRAADAARLLDRTVQRPAPLAPRTPAAVDDHTGRWSRRARRGRS